MKTALALAIGVWSGLGVFGQVPTNFFLLDSLSTHAVRELVKTGMCDSAAIVPMESGARWLVVEKWTALGKTVSAHPLCTLAIADCAVRYTLYPASRDSIERQARVELRLLSSSGVQRAIAEHRDTIARSDLVTVELPRSELTSSPVPPPPRSLWDDLLEPVVIVASVATTLLLLFTARSR